MYNRLFTKILDSSIWLEPHATRIVWVTLLAAMDEDGIAHFSALENLAGRARVSLKEAERAVECFLAPDKNSGDPDNDGRRVERIPGGFIILNSSKYRAMFKREIQREQTRLRVAKHRETQKPDVKHCSDNNVTLCNDLKRSVTQSVSVSVSESIANKSRTSRFAPPTQNEADLYAAKVGVSPDLLVKWFAYYETNGWKVGRNPMKSWQASLRYWKVNQFKGNGHAQAEKPALSPTTTAYLKAHGKL